MEEHGFVTLAIVPLRELPSHQSQMVSQLLFGEDVAILHIEGDWLQVKNSSDGYIGWMEKKQLTPLTVRDYHRWNSFPKSVVSTPTMEIQLNNEPFVLPAGALLGCKSDFSFSSIHVVNNGPLDTLDSVIDVAKQFLNAPYLWGGKSFFGFDCSGFTQVVFSIKGFQLFRDASLQAKQGDVVNFIEEVIPGDLAFFLNPEENVTHVGIMLSPTQIIHCSGSVRIDQIDHQGIFNIEQGKYTHSLGVIKRIRI